MGSGITRRPGASVLDRQRRADRTTCAKQAGAARSPVRRLRAAVERAAHPCGRRQAVQAGPRWRAVSPIGDLTEPGAAADLRRMGDRRNAARGIRASGPVRDERGQPAAGGDGGARRLAGADLVICADNDRNTAGQSRLTAATAAAKATGAAAGGSAVPEDVKRVPTSTTGRLLRRTMRTVISAR
jgi:hypothetical protein